MRIVQVFELTDDPDHPFAFRLDADTCCQGGLPTTGDALDWLCLTVPAHELPKKFARSVRASDLGDGSGKGKKAAVRAAAKKEDALAAEERRRAAQERASAAQNEAVARARKGNQTAARPSASTADDAAAARRWILDNYAESDEGSGESDNGGDDGAAIDDWLHCADVRERERRAAERRDEAYRSSLPRDEHAQLVADDYTAARARAMAAKDKGDRDAQKEAGMAMRELKAEANKLGMSAEELEVGPLKLAELAAAAEAAEEEREEEELNPNDRAPAAEDEVVANWEHAELATGLAEEEEAGSEADGGTAAEQAAAAPAGGGDSDSDGSGFDLADVWDALPDEAVDEGARAPAPPAPAAVMPLGDYTRGKRSKLRPDPRLTARAEPQRLPKAVLQAHCQKKGLPAPRFEKRAAGDPARPGVPHYTAHVAAPPQRRRKGGGGARAGPVAGDVCGEDEDLLIERGALSSVQDAQNAAAVAALFALLPDQPLGRTLPQPYAELWQRFEARAAARKADEANGKAAKKVDFIDSLIKGGDGAGEAGGAKAAAAPRVPYRPAEAAVERTPKRPTRGSNAHDGAKLRRDFIALRERKNYAASEKKRHALPIAKVRQDAVGALKESDVLVLSGATGSGKTTQVPQYLLEEGLLGGRGDACQIVCTQPRRIAAISVAERVASERCGAAPGARGGMVGYHVRLDAMATADTKLLFCTTGILLRRLASDPDLDALSHVVVDEVHERSLQSDFLLVLLRDVVQRRRARGDPLKLVLMSATLDAGRFCRYFGGCPHVSAEGRTFPVEAHYLEDAIEMCGYALGEDSPCAMRGRRRNRNSARNLASAVSERTKQTVAAGWGDDEVDGEALNPDYDSDDFDSRYSDVTKASLRRMDESRIDYELIERLLERIDERGEPGAVLVFLPGAGEISQMLERLRATRRFGRGAQAEWLLPLHSQLPPQEQRRVFKSPPRGVRKVVLGTNIMETSITIDDVVFCVDTGKVKNLQYSPSRRMTALVEEFVSRAASEQRKGRAGRVQPGQFYALYTRARFERKMRAFTQPEIVRVPLADTCLQIKLLGVGAPAEVLARTVEPPAAGAVTVAIQTLVEVGAMDSETEALTPLGEHLARLPVDVRVGKLLVYGALLGCLDPVLTIAACLSDKSPFAGSIDSRELAEAARRAFAAALPAAGVTPPPGSAATLPGIRLSAGQESDHLSMAAAYLAWRHVRRQQGAGAARALCRRHWLSEQSLGMISDLRSQFFGLLRDAGLVRGGKESKADDLSAPYNAHASRPEMVKAVLAAGLYPNIAAATKTEVKGGSVKSRVSWADNKGEVAVHPSSALASAAGEGKLRAPFVVFHEKVQTSRAWLRTVSCVSPMALLLFGGEMQVLHDAGEVLVDGWLRARAPAQTAVLCKQLRALLDGELQRRIEAGRGGEEQRQAGGKDARADDVMATVAKVLADDITK